MTLPAAYAWLEHIQPPRIIEEGLKLYGIKEIPGPKNAPEIMAWAKVLGLEKVYRADLTPWCGLFAAYVMHLCDWPVVTDPLWALNWAKFGDKSVEPGLGDVLVYQRAGGGHVGFYVGEDAEAYHTLGGNEGDAVSIIRILKKRMVAARRPHWRIAQPESVKPYHLASSGGLSTNEG